MERARVFNIPNAITVARMGLAGMFLASHFAWPERRALSAACFAAAGCTDFLDGMAARRLHQVTWLGKLLDPMADKLLCVSALICLTDADAVPLWITGLIIMKELYMFAGASALLGRRVVIQADMSGKAATMLFIPSVVLLYPWHGVRALYRAGRVMIYAFTAISMWSAAHYTVVAVKKSRTLKTD